MSDCVEVHPRGAITRLMTAVVATHLMAVLWLMATLTSGCGGGGGNSITTVPVQPALSITSPTNLMSVNTGDTLKITVQAKGASKFTRGVVCIGGHGLGATAIDRKPPFDFSLAVPSSLAPGQYHLTALGFGAAAKPLAVATVTIQVESPSALLSLVPPASEIAFSAIGEQLPLRIQGTDSTGKLIDLTESSHLLYGSSDETVGTVNSHGLVTAVGPGKASINLKLDSGGAAALSIQVMAPALLPSATSLDFGNQAAGTKGAAKALTITNNVRYPLRILAINSPLNFPQTNDCTSKSPLASGASCVITVTFAPNKAGSAFGIVSIADSAVIARTQVFLTGTGK
jgi:hypothetical protein